MGLDTWWNKLQLSERLRPNAKPLELLSALLWRDEEDLMVVTWLDTNRSSRQRNEYLRTYWAREGQTQHLTPQAGGISRRCPVPEFCA